ncbi:MAG: nucleotidyltransferase family protein [Pseudomonadota bacterium]
MAKQRIFMAVLAAGSSSRFGKDDKLAARFRGKRLGEHICDNALTDRIAPDCAVVIASCTDHPCRPAWEKAGFQIALNGRAQWGIGTSVALAALLAKKQKCDALLIALADMPLVPQEHLVALIDACRTASDLVCSTDGQTRTPPAIFGRDHIAALTTLDEDVGARALLKSARTLACPPEWLVDIDTPEALRRLA